jgi:hypothetical protein
MTEMMRLRSDLPIKYYLGLHNEEGLSDKLTLLFEISQYLIRVHESKGKALDLDSMKFSSKSLKYVFGDKIKDETFKATLVKSLKELISQEYLKPQGDFMFFTKKSIIYFYVLND